MQGIIISKLSGNLGGLKANQVHKLKSLSEKRLKENSIISFDMARTMTELSQEMNRQIGILIDRAGYVQYVMVGSTKSIEIPNLNRVRATGTRLRGLRLVHTHLNEEILNEEDLADLVLLRLDYITAIISGKDGIPKYFYSAYVNDNELEKELWKIKDKEFPGQLNQNFLQELEELEFNLSKFKSNLKDSSKKNRAFLIGVYLRNKKYNRSIENSLSELKELCSTAEITVVDNFYQKKNSLDPATVIGVGKIKEILLEAVKQEIELLVFDLELTPSQAKKISDFCDLKVIDRTQLILDIFARNAKSRDGKLQVELAQLKYLKGRLSELDDNMSRLTGGIGGRGPGETKLEIGKRRVEEKISFLEKELKSLKNRRELNRKMRKRNEIPVVAIVGYTNAGKSTLLNTLTNSDVIAENKLFATLDPTTRRIRFPEEREIILSDTVGFIHDLPPELTNAFKATLEELGDADLLLHVIDISNPNYTEQITAVEHILDSLELNKIKKIQLYNKIDSIGEGVFIPEDGLAVSGINRIGLEELLNQIEETLWGN